jgi:hypothetical protein
VNAALNSKHRTVLDESQIQMLVLVVAALRKSKGDEAHARDLHDCRDVLFALTISGYAIVPQGALDGLKDILITGDL